MSDELEKMKTVFSNLLEEKDRQKGSVFIDLYDPPINDPVESAQFFAALCYHPSIEEALAKMSAIPVDKALFQTGHHTTLANTNWTFIMDRIPVSLCTFGLHLTHPFYNSTQRSGRFCSKMFEDDKWSDRVEEFLDEYLDLRPSQKSHIVGWVQKGVDIYNTLKPIAETNAAEAIARERPKASGSYIKANSSKFAQEQLRNFISTIFPTGLSHSMNTVALASMYHSAWDPVVKKLLTQMVDRVIAQWPSMEFIKNADYHNLITDCMLGFDYGFSTTAKIVTHPSIEGDWLGDFGGEEISRENNQRGHVPLDLLHFNPNFADLKEFTLRSEVQVSTATFGQDQRHRTIHRSAPSLTNSFYLPPLLRKMDPSIAEIAKEHYEQYLGMVDRYGVETMLYFMPYGGMVRYTKTGNGAAVYHEHSRRTCWNAQEEVCCLAELANENFFRDSEQFFKPPCQKGDRKCPEGKRYCGRDLVNIKENNPHIDSERRTI